MILGLSLLGFVHTVLSLVALIAGLSVVAALLRASPGGGMSVIYLVTAVATSATGVAFPRGAMIVPHLLGWVALALLAIAVVAGRRESGAWRACHAVAIVMSVHLLMFFTIGEAFLRLPPLRPLAPTLTEGPFIAAQAVALAVFAAGAIVAAIRRARA